MSPPLDEYRRRRDERAAEADTAARRSRRLSHARVAAFFVAVAVGWVASQHVVSWWTLPAPIALFVFLVTLHDRADHAQRRAERARDFYSYGIDRLEERWHERGEPGTRFFDENHPYARDLDLFGKGSLFARLSTARTRLGEETLAGWLLAPAPAPEVRLRQAAVDELRPRLDLREQLALAGADVRAEVDGALLSRWGGSPAALRPSPIVWALLFLVSLAALTALLGWVLAFWSWQPTAAITVLVALVHNRYGDAVKAVHAGTDRPGRDLVVLAQVTGLFEREKLTSTRLAELSQRLHNQGAPASQRIAQLGRLIAWADAMRNQFFALVGWLTLWPVHFAFAIERWRARSGGDVARWLGVVGELEALASLAGYAWERPHDPFPTLHDQGAAIEGVQLGHPLLPESGCIRNDLHLGGARRLYVVSGSNMSGKSTMLRTVGCNVVLALAGAPVRADSLTLSPLQVGSTLRIQDSLAEGASRFYAEITRLKQLVDLSRAELPLLFLLDEILAGTNSHDRRIGAEAVVRDLVERGAIGLVTTHDLALADVATSLGERARNVHFEDKMVDGRLQFDYRMRDGVVQHSNAIALMRAVGLDV